jgi:hypothetical protein
LVAEFGCVTPLFIPKPKSRRNFLRAVFSFLIESPFTQTMRIALAALCNFFDPGGVAAQFFPSGLLILNREPFHTNDAGRACRPLVIFMIRVAMIFQHQRFHVSRDESVQN